MKSKASDFWRRGVVFIFATEIFETKASETAEGDGLNLRPND
jgi:hypothetical protein